MPVEHWGVHTLPGGIFMKRKCCQLNSAITYLTGVGQTLSPQSHSRTFPTEKSIFVMERSIYGLSLVDLQT